MKTIHGSRTALLLGLFVITTLAVVPDASGQYFGRNKVQYESFKFQTFKTNHYNIYFYPEEEQAVEDQARMAERWYDKHSATFVHGYDNKPLIFYANDADFQQTNVIEGQIGEGTGGVTEGLMDRVIMPLTGVYAENDHVLGHELVHTFQYDYVQSAFGGGMEGFSRTPLWLVEGMAEYLSIGHYDPHTAMWMRDAVLQDKLPTINQLTTDTRFFPYRYGEAYMSFIAGHYGGDRAVAELFKRATAIGLDSAVAEVTGLSSDSLSALWARETRDYYTPLMKGRVLPADAGRLVLAKSIDAGDMNIAPALSPDGRYVAFLSERSLFEIGLYVADARTGKVIKSLTSRGTDPHFDAIRFINSAGTWSPDGRRFAYVVFAQGDNRIEVLDVNTRAVDRSIRVQGVGALQNPSWSPDGRYIAFSGIHGGISDLYLYDIEAKTVRQLTSDRFADIHPSWSPDGKTLVFSTDRGPGGTDFDKLFYAQLRLGFIDVATGDIRVTVPFANAKHINPEYAPDGQSVYFISDRDGFSNIYRVDTATSQVSQVTNLATGVSGITALAPAMSVASQTGAMMFSVYSDGNYSVFALEPGQTAGTPVTDQADSSALAGFMPPAVKANISPVGHLAVTEPAASAQSVIISPAEPYSARLHLAYVGQPSVGVGYDQQFGGLGIAGGVSFFFTDMLGNHLLGAAVQANGTIRDVGGQVQYINRAHRFNWGAQVSHIPYLTGFASFGFDPETGLQEYDQYLQRYYFSGGQLMGAYPLSTTRRLETNVGYTHIGSSLEVTRLFIDQFGNVVGRTRENQDTGFKGLHLVQGSGALVSDYSFFGFTSPVRGGRYRFEAGYTAGSYNFGTLLTDYRRYFFFNPITFAVSAYHYGRYGPGSNGQQLYPINLGYSTYNMRGVHGYAINSFDVSECRTINGCAVLQRVIGSRVAVASAELRLPLFGTRDFGLLNFPYLPTELVAFFDGGVAWSADRPPVFKWETSGADDNVPVFSTGAAARINVLGYIVLEVFYAYPFQRPDKGGYVGLALLPGW